MEENVTLEQSKELIETITDHLGGKFISWNMPTIHKIINEWYEKNFKERGKVSLNALPHARKTKY